MVFVRLLVVLVVMFIIFLAWPWVKPVGAFIVSYLKGEKKEQYIRTYRSRRNKRRRLK